MRNGSYVMSFYQLKYVLHICKTLKVYIHDYMHKKCITYLAHDFAALHI